jgi:hypothetical protein
MTDTIIEILIDASGSMGFMKGAKEDENKYLIDGQTRMSLIKKMLLTDIIPTIDYCVSIIIRTFRTEIEHQGDKIIHKGNQTPIIYQGAFDRLKIETVINQLSDPPMGGTPITAAINEAVIDLEKHPNNDRKIILLTDGEENGEGNYIEAAKKASSLKGIPCKIFIVGIAQDKSSEDKAKEIANGGYINLNSSKFSATELKIALAPIKAKVLQDSIKNIESKITQQVTQQPKPHHTVAQPKIIQTLKDKIETVKNESNRAATKVQLEELESKIKKQISDNEKLLYEISSLKDILRMDTLLELGIDATTLTIDNEYSETIRQKSELFLYSFLCSKYGATKIKWLNEKAESFSNHDFELLDENGNTIQLIECKGTPNDKPTFYLTVNEWNHFLKNKDIYTLYRIFNVDTEMKLFCIENLLTSILSSQVVPYLLKPEILKKERVFLTLTVS